MCFPIIAKEHRRMVDIKVGIVAIAKLEHDYILEFVEHHRSVGVSAFYIYDNGEPEHVPLQAVLAEETDCHVISFPLRRTPQPDAYRHFLEEVMPTAPETWFAFLDVDEFIVCGKHSSLLIFLQEYGHLEAIGINWRMFGASGHVRRPLGKVADNYTMCVVDRHVKTLAHRSSLARSRDVTCPHNVHGLCRSLGGELLHGPFCAERDDTGIICINHYFSKSWEEYVAKCARGRAMAGPPRTILSSCHHVFGFDQSPCVPGGQCGKDYSLEDLEQAVGPNEMPGLRAHVLHNEGFCAVKAEVDGQGLTSTPGAPPPPLVEHLTLALRTKLTYSRVLEVGFDSTGLTAAAILGARADTRLVSVLGRGGLGDCATQRAKQSIERHFRGRHTLVSQASYSGSFDVLVFNQDDSVAFGMTLSLMRRGGMVIAAVCGDGGNSKAWDRALAAGALVQTDVIPGEDGHNWLCGAVCGEPVVACLKRVVLYAYCEICPAHIDNFRFFVTHGMQCAHTHYVIIVNGAAHEPMPPETSTVTVVRRDNKGFDFGAWAAGLDAITLTLYRQFVFLNGSCRGPFLPDCVPESIWVAAFCSRLSGSVHCVGPAINIHKVRPLCKPHVQTYAWAATSECVHMLLEAGVFAFQGTTKDQVIQAQEIGTSTLTLARGWELACFVPEFDALTSYQPCNEAQLRAFNPGGDKYLGDLMYPEPLCFGRELGPVELMFIKTNRGHTSYQSLQAQRRHRQADSMSMTGAFACTYTYGSGTQTTDVTATVHDLVRRGVYSIPVTNTLFGDPHYGVVKCMTVSRGGVSLERILEDDVLCLGSVVE